MDGSCSGFERSIREQIAINQARTPTERFLALCELLDAVRAMAPDTPEARERRRRAMEARKRDKERWRAEYRRLVAVHRAKHPGGV